MSFVSFVPKTTLLSGNFGYYNPPGKNNAIRPKSSVSSSSTLHPTNTPKPRLRKPKKSDVGDETFSGTVDVLRILGNTLSNVISSVMGGEDEEENKFSEEMLFSPTREPPKNVACSSTNKTTEEMYKNKPIIQNEDFDLIEVDLQVREYLSSRITTLQQLEHDLSRALCVLKSDTADETQKVLARENTLLLRRSIKDLESTMEYALYDYRTSTILEEYSSLAEKNKTKSFLVNKTRVNVEQEKRLQELRNTYIGTCRQHLDVRIQKKRAHRSLICGICGCTNMRVNIEDDSLYVCMECYAEEEILIDAPSFKDTDRVNLSSKYTYTRKGHFIDASKHVQGTQNIDNAKIEKVIEYIHEEMEHHNLVAEQGKPNSVTMDNIYLFLTEKSLREHYEDLFLLHSMITGVPCIDFSEYMDDLLNDFEQLEEVLEKIKDENRINSLNVYFKLCALLQRRGFKCKKDDFYILKTKTKEDEHNEKLEEAYALLGWEWKTIV